VTGFIRTQYLRVGATAAAAIVALGLVTVPPQPHESLIARTEFAAVQLQAAISTQVVAVVDNLANSAAAVASIAAAAPEAAPTAQVSAGPSAAAADDPDAIPRTIARIALTAVGLAISPLWYLGFPVTIPLMFVVANSAFPTSPDCFGGGCEVNAFAAGFRLLLFVGGWLGFPLVVGALADVLFPVPADDTGTLTALQSPTDASPVAAARTLVRSAAPTPEVRAEAVGAGGAPLADPATSAETATSNDKRTDSRHSLARRARGVTQRASAEVVANTETDAQSTASAEVVANTEADAQSAARAEVVANTGADAATTNPAAARQSAHGAERPGPGSESNGRHGRQRR